MNTNLNISNSEYNDLISQKAQKSPILKNIFFAFIIGGLICSLGQFTFDTSINMGISKDDASTVTSICLILLGAFLTAVNLYSRLGKIAGAGSTIPITGFSNSIVAPAIEFKSEGYILGIGANMFKVAGPVLVYGTTTAVILGFIYYIFNYIF
mgnify:FL=1